MQYQKSKWSIYNSKVWLFFSHQVVLNDGTCLKWFYEYYGENPNLDQIRFSGMTIYAHRCSLSGDMCWCDEFQGAIKYVASVCKKDGRYIAHLTSGNDLKLPEKCNFTTSLSIVEKHFLKCECGSSKLNLPHSSWCIKETFLGSLADDDE